MATQSYSTPKGLYLEIWQMLDDERVDELLSLEAEIAQEQNRLPGNTASLLRLAWHEGFLQGIEHIREILGDAGSHPPARLYIGGQRCEQSGAIAKPDDGAAKTGNHQNGDSGCILH